MTARSNATNLYLQGDIAFDCDHPINEGGYGELFAGSHKGDGKVALKRLRIRGAGDDRQRHQVETLAEARVWRALVHPNVLTFLGILFEGRDVYLVSPLVEHGSLPQYISSHPDADRAALLKEVAEGLAYLHSQGVIHGGVKGTNILVQSGPCAALCDFGLSKILATSGITTKGGLGTFRWQSPDLMEGGPRSFEADVYAYGMTVYEIISGKIPFHGLTQDSAVIMAVILRYERPSFEAISTDSYSTFRDVATSCWAKLPGSRPAMTEVSRLLSPRPPPLPPPTLPLQTLNLTIRAEIQPSQHSDGVEGRQNQQRNHTIASPVDVARLQGHTGPIFSVAFSPDGLRLASGSSDKTVKMWNVASGATEVTLQGHTIPVSGVAFSPDGSQIASGSYHDAVRLWDTMSGVKVATLQGHGGKVNTVAFSPDGSRMASGSYDRTVRLWDVISGDCISTLEGHTHGVLSVAFSPDGSKLMSGSLDKTVQRWNATSGVKLMTLQGHIDRVRSVAFSADGMQLVSGSWDKTVRTWDVLSGKEIMTLRGHTGYVVSIAFSPDGSQIASGGQDQTVRLWDVTSGAEIATLKAHKHWVCSVAFSPDGTRLASSGGDCTIRIWKLD